MLPGSTPPDSVQAETTSRPRQAAPINRDCDAPIVGANGKPSRAARREANRAAKAAALLVELAHQGSRADQVEWVDVFAPTDQPAPDLHPVPGLLTAKERDARSKEKRSSITGIGALDRGRPSSFTAEEGDAFCAYLQAGGSMRAYCRDTGRASVTLYKWMRENAVFLAQVSRAHEDRADTLADEGLEIVDASAVDATIEGVAAAKLRWEARKWIASKLRPTKWGDKQTVEHVGAVNIRIGIPQKAPLQTVEEVIPDARYLDDSGIVR